MRSVSASEAKTHFLRLLDDIENGEEIVITRHGRPICRLVPEAERRKQHVKRFIETIEAVRKRTKPVTIEELLSARDEGRR